jgi:hypothetical protein
MIAHRPEALESKRTTSECCRYVYTLKRATHAQLNNMRYQHLHLSSLYYLYVTLYGCSSRRDSLKSTRKLIMNAV